ncbi:MAG: response regulator [Actinobacteria bacterium]|nr:response regulator [Actinomycetota bacterium]
MTAETVLVVDDDRVMRLLCRRVLERGGYAVIEGKDGAEGIDLAMSRRPAVAIFDWEMPGLSGVEACRLLRGQPDLAGIIVVVLSGHDDDEHRAAALAAGADDYLVKPIEPRRLVQRVGELVGARAA